MKLKMDYIEIIQWLLVASIGIFFVFFATTANGQVSSVGEDRFCLAQNIYFESGNQPLAGRIAVAQVTINRMEDEQFPDSICGVVYQARMGTNWRGEIYPLRNKCQFSWFCDGKSDTPTDSRTWVEAVWLAGRVIDLYYPDFTEGALWYHSDAVTPYWSHQLNRTVTIDNHLFYN